MWTQHGLWTIPNYLPNPNTLFSSKRTSSSILLTLRTPSSMCPYVSRHSHTFASTTEIDSTSHHHVLHANTYLIIRYFQHIHKVSAKFHFSSRKTSSSFLMPVCVVTRTHSIPQRKSLTHFLSTRHVGDFEHSMQSCLDY
jgi:hypothetical protein